METLKFELTIEEANKVLQGLSQLPYASVVDIINKMQKQASEQMSLQTSDDAS